MCYSIMVEQDLRLLETTLGASIVRQQFDLYEQISEKHPKKYKPLSTHPRIYPGYFAPVALVRNGRRWLLPMRYRIRPHESPEEVPAKYNLFNARLDALESRKTWKSLFMRQHGVVAVKCFFEWVEDSESSKKTAVAFSRRDQATFFVPVLWDYWADSQSAESFFSFAVITSEPPPSVVAGGHDRCPIEVSNEDLGIWLSPNEQTRSNIHSLLARPIGDHFAVRAATP